VILAGPVYARFLKGIDKPIPEGLYSAKTFTEEEMPGFGVSVWMIFTTLAGRSLARAAQEVERPLRENDLAESRIKLSWIVGR
ncbi:hypothetical protein MJL79_32500, partial [Salmonella enterica subsp. enterica serovar Montevideo]|nr:hypothetical protein [Salmonella enterica subsp. enterica serovar Montevideo]